MTGNIGSIYGVEVYKSRDIPKGKWMPITRRKVVISDSDYKKLMNADEETTHKILASLVRLEGKESIYNVKT